MAKKKAHRYQRHESNLKAVASLVIVLVGVVLFVVFYQYKDNLTDPSNFKLFITLAVLLAGFLVGLLYLINPKK